VNQKPSGEFNKSILEDPEFDLVGDLGKRRTTHLEIA
jgi:hypothetical protein